MAPAFPKGSMVLVTGVNGFIGSHVADQLMKAGYRVRGTTRNISKVQGLSALWKEKFGEQRFQLATVEDMAKEGAFDEVIKGVFGVAHVASNLTSEADSNKVIPEVLAGEPSVKRFVFTSSSTTITAPIPNKEFVIDENGWNEVDIKAAWAPPPYNNDRKWAVYGSSKMEAERALWKFVKERKPQFVVNAVLPNANFGKILVKGQPASTGDWVTSLFKGNIDALKNAPPQWFVDVQDNARIHVAALINPEIQNERIIAFAEPYNANDILKILRTLRPDHEFPEDFVDDNVLKQDFGQSGWTSLTESLRRTIENL
ncbi:NAD(P)-binding protein [Stipitochalara longipes BDJ]|nr:NAD(P)-binding protein [Stipitochalara longipes BDJ]